MSKRAKGFINEFKEFAMRGNVIDLAVGVVIGGAFNKIVSSLVNDVIMPPIGVLTGGVNFTDLAIVLKPAVKGESEAVLLKYGSFIQNIVDFLIIALSIFIFIKVINKLKEKREKQDEDLIEESEEVEILTKEEELLTEIRDLLKSNNKSLNDIEN